MNFLKMSKATGLQQIKIVSYTVKQFLKILLFALVMLPVTVACNQKEGEEELDGASSYSQYYAKWLCIRYYIDGVEQDSDGMYLVLTNTKYKSNLPFLDKEGYHSLGGGLIIFKTSGGRKYFKISAHGNNQLYQSKAESISLNEKNTSEHVIRCDFVFESLN